MKKILLFLFFILMSIGMWGATYQLVTDVNNLSIGDEIIIVNTSNLKALGTTQNTNNRNAVSVSISSNQIEPGNAVLILTLGKTNNHWTLYTGSGYLYAASSSNNYLRTQTTNNANGEWTITISNNNATITAQGSYTRNILKYNSGNTIFSCYSSGQQPVQIFKKIGSVPIEYTVSFVNELGKNPNSITQASLGANITLPTNINICNKCYSEEWEFYGWTVDRNNNNILFNPFAPTKDTTLYALYSRKGIKDIEIDEYKLVSKEQDDWEGKYLIAYIDEFDNVLIADGRIGGGDNGTGGIMTGGTKLDPGVNLTSDSTILLEYGDLYNVTIEHLTETTYGIKTKDGYYNYGTKSAHHAKSNNTNIALKHQITIEFNNKKDVTIRCYDSDNDVTNYMRYNTDGGGFFRFYAYGQKSIALFKRQKSHYNAPIEYSTSPECDSSFITTWNKDKIFIDKGLSYDLTGKTITITDIDDNSVLTSNVSATYDSNTDLYQINTTLTGKECDKINIFIRNNTDSTYLIYKVPFMVDADSYTNDMNDENCDIVVLPNTTLTIPSGTKVNRDVKLYSGAHLSVPSGASYTVNSLSLRKENLTPSTLGLTGTLNASKLYFDLYIDYTDWYWTCLPAEYNMSNLKYVNGRTPTYESDYWVRWYDGKHRAATQSGSWKGAPVDTTFQQGAGFLFGLSDDLKKKEFRFELPTSALTVETGNKTLENLHAWGGNTDVRPNHKGWNMIGNPFLNSVITNLASPIREDSLVKVLDGSGNWTGQWELSNTTRGRSLRYAVIPSNDPEDADAGWYKSVVLDDITLYPFTCFFVQIGGNNPNTNQTITFNAADRGPLMAPRRAPRYDEDEELFLRVRVGNRKTGCFISNKFTDEYEPGDDLESRYPIYQSIGGYKLLYSAINDSIIEQGVQVTAPQGTLYLDPKVDINKFEYIYAHYNDDWYDLKNGQTAEVNGTFILQAKRKINDTPTDLEDVVKSNTTDKFIYNGHMYIKKNNHVYSVFGGQVK